ncbi:ZIP family metal transporter [Robertmurraya korlensis]|uniref:ZIP family metal transporter n=1 Tax=Robertmurraya korlensis TaxID=519977 RepID=UPI00203A557F|nr:ZIP family metal transporter [Robertmurraya korlensis]MCM3601013.1 ZIP family metal transporter [Robertmurraya korlensis]
MWNATIWGAISGSAVLIGALLSMFISIPKKIIGLIMAFGTGVLIGAASYELLGEAVEDAGIIPTSIGFVSGALVFTIFDYIVSKNGASQRKRSVPKVAAGGGLAIFFGTIMDAIPESIMIGASLIEQQSVNSLLVISIFISNIPEGLSSTVGMKDSGYSNKKVLFLWIAVLVASALASLGGYFLLDGASVNVKSGIAAFAGGGIIAMVASTMMPEAYEDSGPITGLSAALGLLASIILDNYS